MTNIDQGLISDYLNRRLTTRFFFKIYPSQFALHDGVPREVCVVVVMTDVNVVVGQLFKTAFSSLCSTVFY